MKYVKKYKLFETDINYPISKYDVGDIKDEIKFAFADISDLGYSANAYPGGVKDEIDTGIDIYIRNIRGYGSYSEVKETLLFAIPYIEEKYKMEFKYLRFDDISGDSIFNNPEYIEDRKFSMLYLTFE